MSADFRPRASTSRSRPRVPHRGRRTALVAIAASLAALAFGASASLADTGSVYFDSNGNAAAGGGLFSPGLLQGVRNVGLGASVFQDLETGSDNVAIGDGALNDNNASNDNIAIGSNALRFTFTKDNQNIGIGSQALKNNTNGDDNVATGFQALSANTLGNDNIAAGANALNDNTSGDENLAIGKGALTNTQLANDNVAIGLHALFANTNGLTNTAVGVGALNSNTGGDQNLALGAGAGANLTTGNDNIDIANPGQAGEAGTIRIGSPGAQNRAFLQGVSGTAISGAATRVLINANGQLGTAKAPAHKPGGGGAVAKLRAQNRRQTARIAKLEREVNRLSDR